jgi:hypothetical protein
VSGHSTAGGRLQVRETTASPRGTRLEEGVTEKEVPDMKDRFWRATALVAVIAAGACYKATFVTDPASVHKQTTHEEWTHHYAWGLAGEDTTYDIREWCGGDAGMVRTGGNAATVLSTVFTLGIYAPRKVYITCDDGNAATGVQ